MFQVLGPGFGSFYGIFVPLAKEIIVAAATPTGPAKAAAAASEETDLLRGKAMEAIALMGQAVGLETFREDAHQASCFGSVSVRFGFFSSSGKSFKHHASYFFGPRHIPPPSIGV